MNAPAPRMDGIHLFKSPEEYKAACDSTIADVRARLAALATFEGEATIEELYKPFNEMTLVLANGWSETQLLQQVHPQKEMREQGDYCNEEFSKVAVDITLSRPLYEALSKIDTAAADGATKYSLFKVLRDFRRAGVDKDEATRARVRTLNEEITKASQDFDGVIRDDVRHISIDPSRLAGLPQDYVDAHKPGADGKVTITTESPDYIPFLTYADDDAARKELRIADRSRGNPQNDANLKTLLEKRYEFATLLGYPSYAAYDTETKMVGSPEKAQAFLEQINGVVREAKDRDIAILLKRSQKIDPAATDVGAWQSFYLQELVRKEDYALDAKTLRTYFPFSKVKAGIFQLSEELFGITIKDWNTEVWHPSVTAHEIYQGDKLVGRFYLDLHPREGKYNHAANFNIATGIEGEQLPINALVCNFPGGDDANALMEFDDVVVFLHEFGHLLHAELGGHVAWVNNSGVATEWDFVEAPSQLLENWAYDYDTLKRFAVNAAGEAIPEDLVQKVNRARFFGLGIDTSTQLYYASLSMAYYAKDPKTFDLQSELLRVEKQYAPYPHLEGTYFYDNFGHLSGYAASYYTYQWSLAISQDILTRFMSDGMRNTATSLAYRKDVLDQGGNAPADQLVEKFLGRKWTVEAYEDFLQRTE